MRTVLVVGATGYVGRPVAERLQADGASVRLLVRDEYRARRLLGDGFDLVQAALDDHAAVVRAVDSCDGVHISIAGESPEDMWSVEAERTKSIATAAAQAGVRLITYVSGNLVHAEYGPKIPEHTAKMAAEDALGASGVGHLIFRPTYFMENLPRHVHGRIAVTIGRPKPLHMVAAGDFAAMVSPAHQLPEVTSQELVVYGPKALTIQEAVRLYRDVVRPELRCITVPVPMMAAANRLFIGDKLAGTIQLMRLLQRIGERGDPTIADRLLGRPDTTLDQWCRQQHSSASDATAKAN